jgi:hypothetical protein
VYKAGVIALIADDDRHIEEIGIGIYMKERVPNLLL